MIRRICHVSCILLLFVCCQTLQAQTSHSLLRKGNKFYDVNEFSLAEEKYRKALEQKRGGKTSFNLGNSIYKQERYEEAIQHYQSAASSDLTNIEKSRAFHNLGNAHFQNQKLEEAIEAYKQSLRLHSDPETRHNLLASKEILKQMQQQEQQQQQQQDQNGEESEENQEQQDQQEQQQNQDQQEGEEGENSEEQEESQDSTQQIQEGGSFDSTRLDKQNLDSLDAAKLLQIIESEEKKVQEKLRKFNSDRKKQDKDW